MDSNGTFLQETSHDNAGRKASLPAERQDIQSFKIPTNCMPRMLRPMPVADWFAFRDKEKNSLYALLMSAHAS